MSSGRIATVAAAPGTRDAAAQRPASVRPASGPLNATEK
jgi:hypothetical protein